jgi:RimJ/RimL family protein N-acetyltransferase
VPPFPLPDPDLRDDVLRLRPPQDADAAALLEACRDPRIQRFTLVPSPYEEEHGRTWIAEAPGRRAAGEALNLVIAPAGGEDDVLGTIGLLRPDWPNRVVEIGYLVTPWARGHGHAARAVRMLARWALDELGMARVHCDIDIQNAASLSVAERAGFVREGVLRSVVEAKGRRWTLVVYSLVPEDLQERP